MRDINVILKIEENRKCSSRTWLLRLKGNVNAIKKPGQFVNLAIPGKYLRRPISVSRYLQTENEIILLYNVAGEGTNILSEMTPGECLNVLSGLGNGFSIPSGIKHPLLLGGGIGAAPLLQLAYTLIENGKKPHVILGFNTKDESWGMEKELINLGIPCDITTIDGSLGIKGFVTDAISQKNIYYDYFYACGPTPMLKALSQLPIDGELSLECRMGCGFGVCMCCSIKTKNGNKRICKDGPVFKKNELIWI